MENKNILGRILVLDDEPSLRLILSRGLKSKCYEVDTAANVDEAKEFLNEYSYFLAFFDIVMPGGSGLDLLDKVNMRPNAPSVVVMTAEATMDNAVKAMKKGAFDYLTKPFDLDDIEALAEKVAEYRKTSADLETSSEGMPYKSSPDELIGTAPAMQEVFKLIGRSAGSDATILITGPTGSGKELVARALCKNSSRAKGPFVTVNCAAIPGNLLESELFGHEKGAFTGAVESKKGKFSAANGGSMLLDEIGDMPIALQAKMLRILQEREFYPVGATKPVKVDVRLLAATNRDLKADVEAGAFREDLFHRLNVIRIDLPPLRDRKEDITKLADHFLRKLEVSFGGKPKKLTGDAAAALLRYDWPGNVRELENVVRRSALMAPGGAITKENLPSDICGDDAVDVVPDLDRLVKTLMDTAPENGVYDSVIGLVERAIIKEAMKREKMVLVRAAKLLGLNRNTLTKKVGELKIRKEEV